jgi:hypothetical protein
VVSISILWYSFSEKHIYALLIFIIGRNRAGSFC